MSSKWIRMRFQIGEKERKNEGTNELVKKGKTGGRDVREGGREG